MKDSKLTQHHIIPRSRLCGKFESHNTVIVSHIEHDKYHQLFSNKTPVEILHYLVETFWGGNTEFLNDYLNEIENK